MCTGVNAACPVDQFLSTGTVCRSNQDLCDQPETCTGNRDCPADIRRDHGYVFKCSTTCYVCDVKSTDIYKGKGVAYALGGCGIGNCLQTVTLPYPDCLSNAERNCISSLCPNGHGLSNFEVYTCSKSTGLWNCDYKVDNGTVANGVCI